MKNKVLITLGDSLTEGLGCYDLTRLTQDEINESNSRKFPILTQDEYSYQRTLFHQNGWPLKLAKKLGFDTIINLGLASSSQSSSTKQFVEKYLNVDFSNSEVFVMWMISMPERFSFYNDFKLKNYLPTTEKGFRTDFEKSWMKEIKYPTNDSIYETIFFIKVMEQICENNNYQLLITSWVRDLIPKINKIYPSKHFVKPISFQPWDVTNLKKFTESHYSEMGCGHPNEKGYTLIAQNLYEVIIKNHQNFIQGNEKLEIEMIYDGDVVDWKKNKSII